MNGEGGEEGERGGEGGLREEGSSSRFEVED